MRLHNKLSNEECAGKTFTVFPADYDEKQNDGYYDVYAQNGLLLYMLGEAVMLIAYDEERQTVTMRNEMNNEGEEEFTIDYEQYLNDFGMYQTPDELL